MAVPNKFYEKITRDCMSDFKFLCRGTFGTIFRARHEDWRIDVAVKILSRDTSYTQEELLHEARAMDEARFTYVLRLFGLFVDNAQADAKVVGFGGAAPSLGLVMEFMENGSLDSLQYRVPYIPWALRIRILHQVALGMNFLHSLSPPLLHLDLKPSNVLLDQDLHVRVADFGLSKFKRGTTRRSTLSSGEGDVCGGTLEYMPPEAFTDLNYKPTPGADVYSYAILMWSLLSGEEPYQHIHPSNLSSLIRIHIPKGQRPNTKELEEKVHEVWKLEQMIRLMKGCWHDDKTQRPSFRDCSQETEDIYLCYKPQIVAAVRAVQDILAQMDTSLLKKTRSKSFQSQSAPFASFQLEERFETLHVQESPSRQNEAVPLEMLFNDHRKQKSSQPLQRSQSARLRKDAQNLHNEPYHPGVKIRSQPQPTERKTRPLSDSYTFPMFPPGLSYYPQPFCNPHPSDAGAAAWNRPLVRQFSRDSPQSHGGIHFSGQEIKGVQIGDHNYMLLEQSSESKP